MRSIVDDVKSDSRYIVCVVIIIIIIIIKRRLISRRNMPGTLQGRVVGLHGRPTSARLNFRRKRIWAILHIWEPITYISTKFPKNILTGVRDTPPKQNSKPVLWCWRRNSTSGSSFDVSSFRDLPVYKVPGKPLNARLTYCNSTFSLNNLKPTLPMTRRESAVMQALSNANVF